MSSIVDIYDNILKYEGSEIIIIIDQDNNVWFNAKQICKILEYDKNGTNIIIKRYVDYQNQTTYSNIKEYAQYHYNIQDHTIFINEAGLYELVLRSKMPKAVDFKRWITQDVIPEIRKTGSYMLKTEYVNKLKHLDEQITLYKKRIKILENNQKKSRYPEGGYVYVLKPPDQNETDLHKIGQTMNLGKRLNTYNTSLPDNMIVVHKAKTDDPIAVEHCVKGKINHLRYRKNKEYYKIKEKSIIKVVNSCVKDAKTSKNIKRQIPKDLIDNDANLYDDDNDDDNDKKELFAIISVPDPNNDVQTGGNNVTNNNDIQLMYFNNKLAYLHLLLNYN